MKLSSLFPTLIVFAVLSAVFLWMRGPLPEYRTALLMTGNGLMALLSIIGQLMVRRQLSQRPQAFVRGVYGATLMKLMVVMGSLLVYLVINRADLHKPSVFMLFGIYVVYTVIETLQMSRLARRQTP